jgi:dihydroflavonol-4-reductase
MNVLVTGATGLIGHSVAHRLADRGHTVRALVRDEVRAQPLLPARVHRVLGDVTRPESLGPTLVGVEWLFHCAGLPEGWQRDEGIFDRVNRQGTANVLAAAAAARVKRVIYTSTMDVFPAPRGGVVVEGELDPVPRPTAYQRSKVDAEREVQRALDRGVEVVVINPVAVYGPAPVVTGLNAAMVKLVKGQMPLLPPGGMSLAYVDGVADAHLAAAERGKTGGHYLVADGYLSLRELAERVASLVPGVAVPRVAPEWFLRGAAGAMAALGRVFGFAPMVAPGELEFVLWQARADASKATRELGFRPTPLEEGLLRTVQHLRDIKAIPS